MNHNTMRTSSEPKGTASQSIKFRPYEDPSDKEPKSLAPKPTYKDKRSCDRCRKRKVRCVLKENGCTACLKSNLECQFLEEPKSRGRKKKVVNRSSNELSDSSLPHNNSFEPVSALTKPTTSSPTTNYSPVNYYDNLHVLLSHKGSTLLSMPDTKDLWKYSLNSPMFQVQL